MTEKDIRFTQKKIDESWKEQAALDKGSDSASSGPKKDPTSSATSQTAQPKTSKPFMNLITSLGLQAMIHLGEVPNPETQKNEVNLEAAREVIDLLQAVHEKTTGNVSQEETKFLEQLVPELQMKFAQKV